MPVVVTPLITVAGARCVSAVHCMIPHHQGSAVVGVLSLLRRSAVATKHVGLRMIWNLVRRVVELNTSLKIQACVARDQRVMWWYVRSCFLHLIANEFSSFSSPEFHGFFNCVSCSSGNGNNFKFLVGRLKMNAQQGTTFYPSTYNVFLPVEFQMLARVYQPVEI